MKKLDMCLVIVQALYAMPKPPSPDHGAVVRLMKRTKGNIVDILPHAERIISTESHKWTKK
jgi:hypothetical protein